MRLAVKAKTFRNAFTARQSHLRLQHRRHVGIFERGKNLRAGPFDEAQIGLRLDAKGAAIAQEEGASIRPAGLRMGPAVMADARAHDAAIRQHNCLPHDAVVGKPVHGGAKECRPLGQGTADGATKPGQRAKKRRSHAMRRQCL